MIKQEVPSAEVDRITESIIDCAKKQKYSIEKQEYWGLRNLAYRISALLQIER